ncbi:MAG: hypothetical protein HUJ31_18945, partial [Pseudomonadales bacterium]|nr:hypothetical protein [Pseudomonadales bacterium]
TVYLAGKFRTGEASHVNPMLSVAQVDYRRELIERPDEFRDDDEWMVSLAVPWRFEMDKESGAVITVNPTFRLRPFTFGGGNIQVHWPF